MQNLYERKKRKTLVQPLQIQMENRKKNKEINMMKKQTYELALKKETLDLAELFFGSYAYPGHIPVQSFEAFVKQVCIDAQLNVLEDFESEEEVWEADLTELIDNTQEQFWIILYLYNENILSIEIMKKLLREGSWNTSCSGEWIERIKRAFNVRINED